MGLMGGLSGCGLSAADMQKIAKNAGDDGKQPHFAPKAKSVIFLYMDGGISQVDSFDPKPRLDKENGENSARFEHRIWRPPRSHRSDPGIVAPSPGRVGVLAG